jgi:formylglycine-generating enzyme required for sulfatase activity
MIFISYASEDAAVADHIRSGLEQAGVACWIAPRDIESGTSFPAAITAAIRTCEAQVLLLTAQANTSRHVLSEVELAFNAGKPILAVLIGKVAPSADLQYFISTSHWFDAEATFDDADLSKLKVDIEKLLAGERVRARQASGTGASGVGFMGGVPLIPAAIVLAVLAGGAALYLLLRQPASSAPSSSAGPTTTPRVESALTGAATPPPPAATTAPSEPATAPTTPPAAAASATFPRTKVNAADGQIYAWIPPGSFAMGCSSGDGECAPDEMPVHTVRVPRGFWLARTEVTNAQYEKRMPKTERLDAATGSHPVVAMTREEAKEYCAKIGGRLPTEAEWEYAARGGSRERYYDTLSQIAWFEGNSEDRSHPVGQKAPNAYGLHDMLGNVYEWVLDRYYNKYDDTTEEIEEPIPSNSSAVTRGGAWHSEATHLRVSNREGVPRDYADLDTGFRCALDPP